MNENNWSFMDDFPLPPLPPIFQSETAQTHHLAAQRPQSHLPELRQIQSAPNPPQAEPSRATAANSSTVSRRPRVMPTETCGVGFCYAKANTRTMRAQTLASLPHCVSDRHITAAVLKPAEVDQGGEEGESTKLEFCGCVAAKRSAEDEHVLETCFPRSQVYARMPNKLKLHMCALCRRVRGETPVQRMRILELAAGFQKRMREFRDGARALRIGVGNKNAQSLRVVAVDRLCDLAFALRSLEMPVLLVIHLFGFWHETDLSLGFQWKAFKAIRHAVPYKFRISALSEENEKLRRRIAHLEALQAAGD